MIVENCPYLRDPRVRREAKALAAAGYKVTVIAPNGDKSGRGGEIADGVKVYRFAKLKSSSTVIGHLSTSLGTCPPKFIGSIWRPAKRLCGRS
jgi:hypothetical protein